MGGDLSEGVLQVGRREFQEADQLLWLRDQGQRIEEVETALSRGTVGWAENRLTGSVEGPGKARGNMFMGCQPDRASTFFCLPQCLVGESRVGFIQCLVRAGLEHGTRRRRGSLGYWYDGGLQCLS